jgi:hypothetical protein
MAPSSIQAGLVGLVGLRWFGIVQSDEPQQVCPQQTPSSADLNVHS